MPFWLSPLLELSPSGFSKISRFSGTLARIGRHDKKITGGARAGKAS